MVIIGRSIFDLCANLTTATLNHIFLTSAINDGCGILCDNHFLRLTLGVSAHVERGVLKFDWSVCPGAVKGAKMYRFVEIENP